MPGKASSWMSASTSHGVSPPGQRKKPQDPEDLGAGSAHSDAGYGLAERSSNVVVSGGCHAHGGLSCEVHATEDTPRNGRDFEHALFVYALFERHGVDLGLPRKMEASFFYRTNARIVNSKRGRRGRRPRDLPPATGAWRTAQQTREPDVPLAANNVGRLACAPGFRFGRKGSYAVLWRIRTLSGNGLPVAALKKSMGFLRAGRSGSMTLRDTMRPDPSRTTALSLEPRKGSHRAVSARGWLMDFGSARPGIADWRSCTALRFQDFNTPPVVRRGYCGAATAARPSS
ncbi:MAG: hypothetical protein K0Q72_4618 [Armatimonadetes bacterium]|nr:hypothetical protein [Armatimonadota bacterium]